MLRRAIQRTRLHLPAPIGHDNGGCSSDNEDACASPSVAHTTLRDDDAVRDHFRKRPEDVSGVHLLSAERAIKTNGAHVAQLSSDEQRRAADAWARLQTLYGLFRELDAASDEHTEDSDTESVKAEKKQPKQPRETRRRRRDDGLRSLLQEAQLPPGVVLRDLQTLAMTDASDDNAMPQGFTAGMFAALGNAIYNEMMVAAEQNRISPDAFEELGNCLYADAASVTVLATA
ncbi:hypothetical protein PRIC1_015024 [Phytophthora ramorum]|uniref:Uncharacterized protein n=1 Tax=Phytophthora ramorum TaxID=164328 RepID=H3GMH2_PHYRM|nr:hypothetical protein KRP23_13594 [Phytophthora ramorum]KAH7473885.1 hypothetical protein KRP23_8027 [Phytophthora ramorum]KAH7497515.1 hypothetical protein KRP22_12578 [Phytophthora ramorum]